MYKFSIAFLISLLASSTFAADTDTYIPFSSATTPVTNSAGTETTTHSKKMIAAQPAPPALTPKDFKGSVNSAFQQNQDQLNEQIKQNLTKNLPVSAPGTNTQPSNSSNVPIPQNTMNNPNPPNTGTNTNQGYGQQAPSSMNTNSYPPPSATQPTPSPTQSQQYSGFGNGSSNGNKGNQKSSNGWNIQY